MTSVCIKVLWRKMDSEEIKNENEGVWGVTV